LSRSEDGLRKGLLGEHDVVAMTTGVGTRRAAETTERLLQSTDVDHVIVVGVAGGVDPEAGIGDVVVPAVVIAASTGDAYRPAHLGSLPARGRLLTTDDLQTGPVALAKLRQQEVTAVDMETAAIARVCNQRGVPWSVFRSISDTLADGLVDQSILNLVRADGRPDVTATLRHVLRRPWVIPRLARIGRDTKVATTAAATAAIHACRCV
jgi:nucleoside phosphorylase